MDWKTASSYYETRLSDALNVYRHASSLAALPQADVPLRLQDSLQQEVAPTRRQLERLQKREFRIAVVGLEKAGKSTFINAWLECDLLPAKGGRCTFTTTQIYSVAQESEQRLEVQTRTEEQFTQLIEELRRANSQEDLATIEAHRDTLQQVKRDGDRTFPFSRLEDIRPSLTKYVADERYAHAVLEARLYTSKLAEADGIVFYDVPGSDSGLAKHVDEARSMLSDCDAVIVIQRFRSIREAELQIIKFTELGDKNISIADKLFVFLSHIDALGSAEALKTHIEEATNDWAKRANLPDQRIVAGSAGAYLILNHLAEQNTQEEIGDAATIRAKLQALTHIADEQTLNQEATGIPEIKTRIFNYINTERVLVLQKRCEASINVILHSADEMYQLVSQRYSENPEEAEQIANQNRQILFSEWWHHQWEIIKADLQTFYDVYVLNQNPETLESSSSSLERFQERYLQLVETEMHHLREATFKDKETIFAANSNPVFDRVKANFLWRESLYTRITALLKTISQQLAKELQEEVLKLVEYMTQLLWGSSQVQARLIEQSNDYFLMKLETSLSVLFLRFARPVAEALMRGPVNSDTRQDIIKNLGADIEIVDNYYRGNEPAFAVLKRYVKYGSDLLEKPDLRQQILGVSNIARVVGSISAVVGLATEAASMAAESLVDLMNQPRSPQEQVVFEVESDISAFEEYLRSAIFEAAGFELYCIQELKGLVDSFRDKEGTWSGVAQNEWVQGNPSLLAELPANLKSQEIELEVSERLRQLSIALKKAQANI